MPKRKYIHTQKGRESLKKTMGGKIPMEKTDLARTKIFKVPRNLRGIENQAEREKKMYAFLKDFPSSELTRVIKSYGELEKTADGETLAQIAILIRMERAGKK